jgi:hypothetical protein
VINQYFRYRERIESLGLKWMAIEGDLGETLSQTTFGKSMVQNSAPPSYKEIKKVLIPLMEKWFKYVRVAKELIC